LLSPKYYAQNDKSRSPKLKERLYYWIFRQYKNHPSIKVFLSIDGDNLIVMIVFQPAASFHVNRLISYDVLVLIIITWNYSVEY